MVTEAIATCRFGVAEIMAQGNAEVRRVMIDLYNDGDRGKFLRDSKAVVVHADVDELGLPRRLLRIDLPGDEPIVQIELTNSTPEPDGTRKLYYLRVHPELRPLLSPTKREFGQPQEATCANAVASLAGMTGAQYRIATQT
jgi:hypothetical protein